MLRVIATTMVVAESDSVIAVELATSMLPSQSVREEELRRIGELAAHLNNAAHSWIAQEQRS